MSPVEELAAVDAEWDAISSRVEEPFQAGSESAETEPPISEGTFGHPSERRLGLRVPAECWALLSDGERGIYARAVELSPTGVVLKLFDRDVRFDGARSFGLDIFLPNASRPIHATARPARHIGELEAFELSNMDAADRLTLAEHLDDLVTERQVAASIERSARSGSPPVYWRNFVLSLKRRRAPAVAQAQRF